MSPVFEQKSNTALDRRTASAPELRTQTGVSRPTTDEHSEIPAYVSIVRKRRWTVIAVTLIVAGTIAIASFKMRPVYRSTARVEVGAEAPQIQSLSEIYQQVQVNDAYLQTQIQVLRSDNLAWLTAQQLRLGMTEEFAGDSQKLSSRESKVELIAEFKRHLTVDLVPKTRMLEVSFESYDPELASKVSTALVTNYVDYNFRERYDATRQASGWMEQQLDELKVKVERSQQAMVNYERQNAIANTSEKQNVLEQILSDLGRDLTSAKSERLKQQAIYSQIEAQREDVSKLVQNSFLDKLEEKLADLRNQHAESLGQYGPKFPKVQRLQQQIQEAQSQVETERTRIINRIKNDYAAAVTRERLAAEAVARQKQELGALNDLLAQHNILRREFETNQQLYQSLLQRLKDATLSAGLRSTNLHIVDSALPPSRPARPRKLLNIFVGTFAGIIFGTLAAFIQEALDHSIKTAEELESLLGIPALAVIPVEKDTKLLAGDSELLPGNRLALAVHSQPQSPLAESYRALRTSILLSPASRSTKVLLVTSSFSGEGNPVKIVDLARQLIRLTSAAEDSVQIVFTGLRDGEKLHEELFYNYEQAYPTAVSKVRRTQGTQQKWELLSRALLELRVLTETGSDVSLRFKVQEIVPEYSGVTSHGNIRMPVPPKQTQLALMAAD
jgi:polysaccharide biosynthesis transport protein